jgi:2,4-dienoyl-CoA reductase-like NADH-dependent reductase (Old Yellow Enzyme family)
MTSRQLLARGSPSVRISHGKVSDNHHRWAGAEDDAAVIFGALGDTGINVIHTTEYRALAPAFGDTGTTLAELAKRYSGLPIIVNGNLDDPRDAAAVIDPRTADIVALANRHSPIATGRKRVDRTGAGCRSAR